MNLSKHAHDRLQQRGIPPIVVNWLQQYGSRRYDHRGAVIHYFDKKSRKRLSRELGRNIVGRLSDLLDVSMVVSVGDERVVTVAHRYRGKRLRAV